MSDQDGDSAKIDITPEKNGGVFKEILVQGSGEASPPKGVKVIIHYVGKLTDGKQFDSSRDRGEPFQFTLGRGNVIKGFDIGVASMKEGEKSLLTCREDYAYGVAGSPPNIPPKATLVFEVELLEWEPEDLSGKSDKGIIRHPIEAGAGVDSPKDFSEVEITLVGTLSDGKEFFNQRLEFCLGEGIKLGVPKGIEKALKKMVKKEKSRIDLKPQYAWGSVGCSKLGVPPDSPVSYIVTLHNFVIVDSWALNSTEKLSRAAKLKEKGTKYLKDGDLSFAVKMYNKVVELMECGGGFEGSEEEERKKLILAGYLNLSMTYLKLENMIQCKNMCNKALQEDPKSVKALFRRGQAYLSVKEPQLAIKDFKAVLEIEPQNSAATSQLAICQQKAREIKDNEKKIYANMFDKFARKDREWRYGWWEKDKPVVEIAESQNEIDLAEEHKQDLESKRKFVEMKAQEKKVMEEQARLRKQELETNETLKDSETEEEQTPSSNQPDNESTEESNTGQEPTKEQTKHADNNNANEKTTLSQQLRNESILKETKTEQEPTKQPADTVKNKKKQPNQQPNHHQTTDSVANKSNKKSNKKKNKK